MAMDIMQPGKTEVQDIFAAGERAYASKYPRCKQQQKAICSIIHCRRPGMGKHIDKCDHCGHYEISYNSCRNRNCPKCQAGKQFEWIEKLGENLPPVRYFHLVFTLPTELNEIVYKHQRRCYGLFFKTTARTVLQTAGYLSFLGAQTGCLSVLHTWGQNLQYHPHIHMLVPAGGLAGDGMEWVRSNKKFFVPVKVLSKIFRAKFLQLLQESIDKGDIGFTSNFSALKEALYKKNWVVYAKKPFAGPGQVIKYLGRYTHRIAISNSRIIAHKNNKVDFYWKDYRDHNRWKIMQLDTLEFMRRFLLHVLPANFCKIRYYGIFSLAGRKQKLKHCLKLILRKVKCWQSVLREQKQHAYKFIRKCPVCKIGTLRFDSLLPQPINKFT